MLSARRITVDADNNTANKQSRNLHPTFTHPPSLAALRAKMANKKSKQAKKKQADQAAAANGDHNGTAEVCVRRSPISSGFAQFDGRHENEQENQTGAKDEPIEVSSDTPEEEKQPEEVVEEVDPAVQAERVKEQGNAAFKGGRFQEAIGHYGNAIGALYSY